MSEAEAREACDPDRLKDCVLDTQAILGTRLKVRPSVRACLSACVRVCVWACVHVCVRACVYAHVRACVVRVRV